MELTVNKGFKIYATTVPIFFLIDLFWLGILARNFYRDRLGHLMRPTVNWTAAAIFYLLFIAGIVIFAVKPALEAQSSRSALLHGAFFGLVAYATYDLTNLATIRDWPLVVTVVDLIWGTVLCSTVSWIGYALAIRGN